MDRPILKMVRDHFSAPSAVREYQGRVARGLLAWEQRVAATYLQPPGTLLDIGCGAGREAIALHDLGHRVTGIDISPEQVKAARENARRLGKSIEFRTCDGTSLPFPEDSFQYAVMWGQAFGNIPGRGNRLHLLRECERVLAPAGIVILSAHNRDSCEPVARSKGLICDPADTILEDGDFILRDDPQSEAPCFYHYFRRDELADLCLESGLRTLTCTLAADLGQVGWDTIWVVAAATRRPCASTHSL
jgi:SAM-dependent methyltransferase